jgi:hypothetical protein
LTRRQQAGANGGFLPLGVNQQRPRFQNQRR